MLLIASVDCATPCSQRWNRHVVDQRDMIGPETTGQADRVLLQVRIPHAGIAMVDFVVGNGLNIVVGPVRHDHAQTEMVP